MTPSIILAAFLSCFSSAVMSYVALATPIGPWIETSLVLLGAMCVRILVKKESERTRMIALATVAGGIGGIAATATAFSFPTLYFLWPDLFKSWLSQPPLFMAIVAGLVIASGSLAFLFARLMEDKMLKDESLSFPIGQLVARMITAQNQVRQSLELVGGAIGSFIFGIIQATTSFIPSKITLVPRLCCGIVQIPRVVANVSVIPMLLAIGFVTGHVIAAPLLIGVISKIGVIDIIHRILPVFSGLSNGDMTLAFCTGMVIFGTLTGFFDVPTTLFATYRRIRENSSKAIGDWKSLIAERRFIAQAFAVCAAIGLFLWSFNFSVMSQLYLVVFTMIYMYQVLVIAGKTGIAPLGRFATFVMLPGLILFGYTGAQATIVATFVEIAVGVVADLLFGRKMAQELSLDMKVVRLYQWLGLMVSAVVIAATFWILISHFGLGSEVLFAQKAQARALLIKAYSFNMWAMIFGAFFALFLKYVRVNAVLVMGGILMPIEYSVLLVVGGYATRLVKNKEAYYPFWSGIFAASSLWMLLQGLGSHLFHR